MHDYENPYQTEQLIKFQQLIQSDHSNLAKIQPVPDSRDVLNWISVRIIFKYRIIDYEHFHVNCWYLFGLLVYIYSSGTQIRTKQINPHKLLFNMTTKQSTIILSVFGALAILLVLVVNLFLWWFRRQARTLPSLTVNIPMEPLGPLEWAQSSTEDTRTNNGGTEPPSPSHSNELPEVEQPRKPSFEAEEVDTAQEQDITDVYDSYHYKSSSLDTDQGSHLSTTEGNTDL